MLKNSSQLLITQLSKQRHLKPSLISHIQRNAMSNKQHGPAPTKWALDGREQDLLHYIYARPDLKEIKGQPSKVLSAIDDYHSKFNMLMNIGAEKGQHVVDLIHERKPSTMIELGVYVGYSAILFGDTVRSQGGKQYFGIEKNPEMAAVANQLVELAGLRDIVHILVGSSDEVIKELVQEKVIHQIELIFLDHWQDRYLPDMWLMEGLDVLKPSISVVVADNVIMPGAPEYQRWVEATTTQKRQIVGEAGSRALAANPSLVYETILSNFDTDFGPDGVTVTRVVGEEKA